MELDEFLEDRNIDPKIIATLIDLGESVDDVSEYLEDNELKMDRGSFEYNGRTYWVYDEDEAEGGVVDFISEMVEELRAETKHNYDWLIDAIDTHEIARTMSFGEVYPDYVCVRYNCRDYYYQEE